MKILIHTVNYEPFLEEEIYALKKYNIAECEKAFEGDTDYMYSLSIDDFKDLIELIKLFKKKLIVAESEDDKFAATIIIYDDYIE